MQKKRNTGSRISGHFLTECQPPFIELWPGAVHLHGQYLILSSQGHLRHALSSFSFCRWGRSGAARLTNLSEGSQLEQGGVETTRRVCLASGPCFLLHTPVLQNSGSTLAAPWNYLGVKKIQLLVLHRWRFWFNQSGVVPGHQVLLI